MPYLQQKNSSPGEKPGHRKSTSTLIRGLRVLESVAQANAEGLGVTEVSEQLDLDKSTASRVLATLRDAGYVRQDPKRRYHLTRKLSRLVSEHPRPSDIKELSADTLEWLHQEFDEEIHLAVANGGEMFFINYVPSSQRVRSVLPTVPVLVHRSAVGLAVLATLSHEERTEMISEALRLRNTPLSPQEEQRLSEDVAKAQERGWAQYDAGDDITRIAAAIRGSSGQPLGAISLSGPSFRLDDIVEAASRKVMEAAAEISTSLAT